MKVSDLMSTNVVTVPPDCLISDAAKTFERNDIGMVPVCGSDGRIQGILTDRDIVTRCIAARLDPKQTQVSEFMTRGVISVSPDDDIKDAVNLMSGEQVRRLPVVEQDRIIGVISLADLVHSDIYDMEAAVALTEITDREHEY